MGLWRTSRDLLAEDEDRSRRAGVEYRSTSTLTKPSESLLAAIHGLPATSGATVTADSALAISTVYACVRILSESVAQLPLKLYRKTAAGREEAEDHPLWSLLKDAPNAAQTSFEFREMMQGHLCLRGNAYALIERNSYFEPVALRPLHPGEVTVEQGATGALYYRVGGNLLDASRVFHLRALSSNGAVGLSPITIMRDTVGLALAVQNFSARQFANGNRFPGLLKTPTSLKPEQIRQLRDAWDAQRAGDSATKAPILHGGLDWVSVGMNNSDAELIASGTFTRQDIAEAFRVPLVMLAHGEKAATYASVEQFMLSFVNQSLAPWLERWEQRINVSLISEQDRRAGVYAKFNLKALLRGDAKTRSEYYRTMREIRAITINEIRAAEEMNDLPDNIGDNAREDFNGQGGKAEVGADVAASAMDDSEDRARRMQPPKVEVHNHVALPDFAPPSPAEPQKIELQINSPAPQADTRSGDAPSEKTVIFERDERGEIAGVREIVTTRRETPFRIKRDERGEIESMSLQTADNTQPEEVTK